MRDPLEQSLIKAIKSNDTNDALTLINMIKTKKTGPSLKSRDKKNRTFLALAIDQNATYITEELLKIQGNDHEIIFSVDQNQNSLLVYAVQLRNIHLIKQLLALSKQLENTYPLWSIADKEGNTPLHFAAKIDDPEILSTLLQAITTSASLKIAINKANADGNTPLHINMFREPCHCFTLFFQHGAKLNLHNNDNMTAFDAFSKLPTGLQIQLFNSLNDYRLQQKLLTAYRNKLIAEPHAYNLKDVYLKCNGMISLLNLLLSKHEFDDVPIRNTYIYTQQVGNNTLTDKCRTMINEKLIPQEIYSRMPLYKNKVTEMAKALQIPIDEVFESTFSDIPSLNNQFDTEKKTTKVNNLTLQLDDDRTLLGQLIKDINTYHLTLGERTVVPSYNKLLAIFISVCTFPVAAGILYAVIQLGNNYFSENYKENRFWNANFVIGFTLFCAFLIFLLLAIELSIPTCLFNKERNISKREWQDILNRIEHDVLDNLHVLQSKSNTNLNYLPCQPTTVTDIETLVAQLHTDQSISTLIELLSRLEKLLRSLQADINRTARPLHALSLFAKQDTIIEIQELEELNRQQSQPYNHNFYK